MATWWAVTPLLDDAYELFADRGPFLDPLHPAGYGLLIAALGQLTRAAAALTVIQHLLGVGTALLLFDATRRATGSRWVALVPAAVVLLSADVALLEHSVMSEALSSVLVAAGVWALVRAVELPPRSALALTAAAGVVLAGAIFVRTATLPVLGVAVTASLIGPSRRGTPRQALARAGAFAAAAVIVVGIGVAANERYRGDASIGPSQGWQLYGAAAQFAECDRFTPPAGTEVLCERSAPERRTLDFYGYLFTDRSPATRSVGPVGSQDDFVGGWARAAIRAQPGDYVAQAGRFALGFFVPALRPGGAARSRELAIVAEQLESEDVRRRQAGWFSSGVPARAWPPGIAALSAWQRVTRFGALALTVATLLVLLALVVGSRRERWSFLLLAGSGLAMLVLSAIGANYSFRYTIPAAPLVAAGSAVGDLAAHSRWVGRTS